MLVPNSGRDFYRSLDERKGCMSKRSLTWISTLLTGGLLTALTLVPTVLSAAEAAGAQESEQVSKLLSETRNMAFQLKNDAVTMESFRRMNVSTISHAAAINQIKAEINDLAGQVNKLKALENEAAPWQRVAINRIDPYLDELAGYTTAVIERLNGDRTHTLTDYDDYLQANADYATDLAAMLGDFVDYGNAKGTRERLGAKLEIRE